MRTTWIKFLKRKVPSSSIHEDCCMTINIIDPKRTLKDCIAHAPEFRKNDAQPTSYKITVCPLLSLQENDGSQLSLLTYPHA